MNPLAHTTRLPRAARARVLACGAHWKNRACLLEGDRVVWSAAHGDLEEAGCRKALSDSADALIAQARGPVEAIACDLHPDFYSTRLAQSLGERLGIPVIGVQHHLAHVGVVLAEHGLGQAVLGVALDGMGMGLAICRSVIEVHHGGMDAGQSSLGGARFSFTLPVYDAQRQQASLDDEDAQALLESQP